MAYREGNFESYWPIQDFNIIGLRQSFSVNNKAKCTASWVQQAKLSENEHQH